MRFLLALLLTATVAPFIGHAGSTPQEMARLYFDAFKSGDMESMAANMHEEELAKFKDSMIPVIAKNLNPDTVDMTREAVAIRQLAGRDSLEKIQAEDPRVFFLRFMNWMNRMNPMIAKMMSGSKIDTLGYVEEKDMAHVVCRITMEVMGATVSQMKVMSVKKDGEQWKLMLTGEIEGLSSAMQPRSTP